MLDNWFSRNDVLPSGNSLLPANRSWSGWSSLTIIGQAGRERPLLRIIFFFQSDSCKICEQHLTKMQKVMVLLAVALELVVATFCWCYERTVDWEEQKRPPAVLTRMMMVAVVTFHQSYGEKVRAPPKRTPCQADAPNWDNFFRAPNEAWIEHTVAVRQAI